MNESVAFNREKLVAKLIKTIPEAKLMLETMKDQYGIISGMIANHLIEKDKLTKKIYNQLKEEGSYFVIGENEKIYSRLDWYIEYIKKLQSNNELVEEETI